MSTISKTTITFTVMHRTDEPFDGDYPLQAAMARSMDGHAVGWETGTKTVEVPSHKVPDELADLGNDGSFFDEDISEEIRASQLDDDDWFQEDSSEDWQEIESLDQHGDTVLVTTTDGTERSFDIDTVIYRLTKESA